MEDGFVKADSVNLPTVDSIMVANFFISNPDFSASIKNEKQFWPKEKFGDDSVRYVQIRRKQNICIIKCKICPEANSHAKMSATTVIIDEQEGIVKEVQCHDCFAAGCKHSLAFLMWLHRRSEEPSSDSVKCYWESSPLHPKMFITAKELSLETQHEDNSSNLANSSSFLEAFLKEAKKRDLRNCLILQYQPDYVDKQKVLSLHILMCSYKTENLCERFLKEISKVFTQKNLRYAERATRKKHKSRLWYELLYGRITASMAYEVSKCESEDEDLISLILGEVMPKTVAVIRKRKLEDSVRMKMENILGKKITKCGLYISEKFPMIVGSPDGHCEDAVLDIKCPSNNKTMKNYILNGEITRKYFDQMQIQMFVTKVTKCYFCVADPGYEENNTIHIIEVKYVHDYCMKLVGSLTSFWKQYIYPKLYEICH